MFTLILLIIFSIGIGFFATQNTAPVPVILGTQTLSAVPLYIVMLGALLLGIFISWFISLIDTFFATMTILGKNSALKNTQETIRQLKDDLHKLQLENAELRGARNEAHKTERVVPVERVDTEPSTIDKIKHKFSN